jgi:hypothetical protein
MRRGQSGVGDHCTIYWSDILWMEVLNAHGNTLKQNCITSLLKWKKNRKHWIQSAYT